MDDSTDLNIPIRPDFANTTGNDKVVFTYHFVIQLPKDDLFEYKVEGIISDDLLSESKGSQAKREELMQEALKASNTLNSQKGRWASDNVDKIVSWKELSNSESDGSVLESFRVQVQPARNDKPAVTSDLKLVRIGRISIDKINRACNGKLRQIPFDRKGERRMTAIQAINIIIAHAARDPGSEPASQVFQLGNHKFFSTDHNQKFDLRRGLVGRKGFYFTLKYWMGEPLLNVSSAATAFYQTRISIAEFMRQYCPVRHGQNLTFAQLKELKAALKGLRVNIRHENRSRTITDVAPADQTPSRHRFTNSEGKSVSVAEHLSHNKDIMHSTKTAIKNSVWPCIIFGRNDSARHFPAETLFIDTHQAYRGKLLSAVTASMIKSAREDLGVQRDNITDAGLKILGITDGFSTILRDTGVKVDPKMVTVPVRLAKRPEVAYDRDDRVKSGDVRWTIERKLFLERSASILPKCILILVTGQTMLNPSDFPIHDNAVRWIKELTGCFLGYSQAQSEPGRLGPENFNYNMEFIENSHSQNYEDQLNKHISIAKKASQPISLVVLISPAKGGISEVFSDFKRVVEVDHGIHSLCLAAKSMHESESNPKGNKLPQYMANVSMKLNLKLGNTNHSCILSGGIKEKLITDKGLVDTMILGADVGHPAKGSAAPSIAAIVGSVDDRYAKYLGLTRYQKGGTEVIDEAECMFKDRLRAWSKYQKGRLPSNIIYYRDGVSVTQYQQVLDSEVLKIEDAYRVIRDEVGKGSGTTTPRITAVVVTKRHYTRFYPTNGSPRDNCEPSSVVESGVVHPAYFDFYLQSHKPMQGTAKPTYYIVIRNDMAFSAAEIEDLTNAICYSYVRCCSPVGYAPPAYYADRLCEQVRLYIKRMNVVDQETMGVEPQRPARPKDQSQEERSKAVKEYREKLTRWEDGVARAWKERRFGKKEGGVRSNGPWHARLNDTMFWM